VYLFKIDAENRITAHSATRPLHAPKGEYIFADPEDLYGLASGWPASRLVEIWNRLPDTKTVSRFATRKAAVRRIWGVIQKLQPVPLKTKAKPNPIDTRDGTKSARVIALLRRPAGATLTEIMAETGWRHTAFADSSAGN
jgi:hypothetical protein